MSKIKKSILGWIGEKLCEPARIASVEVISEHFRLVQIESPSFAHAKWKPGDKIQINVGDWNVRTYTPISHSSTLSRIQILVFINGVGPGSTWASNLKKGDLCEVLGPRSSLSISSAISSIETPRLLFGDETSFAVAAAMKSYYGNALEIAWVFEVTSVEESKQVCEKIGIHQNAVWVEKKTSASHLSEVLKNLRTRLDLVHRTELFLTGNAKSIQALRNEIRNLNHANAQIVPKAYWSLGKVGLD